MGVGDEAAKLAGATIDAMKSVPLAVALLAVNIFFLGFAAYILGEVATNAKDRNAAQLELIGKLVNDCRSSVTPTF